VPAAGAATRFRVYRRSASALTWTRVAEVAHPTYSLTVPVGLRLWSVSSVHPVSGIESDHTEQGVWTKKK
jgi:hypothetical protein